MQLIDIIVSKGFATLGGRARSRVVVTTTPDYTYERTNERTNERIIGADAPHPTEVGPDPKVLFDLWNENRGVLPAAKEFNVNRRKSAKSRLAERPIEEWLKIIQRLALSNFATGQNDRAWVATFDFMLRPDTAAKVLEGKYDNREKPIPGRIFYDTSR